MNRGQQPRRQCNAELKLSQPTDCRNAACGFSDAEIAMELFSRLDSESVRERAERGDYSSLDPLLQQNPRSATVAIAQKTFTPGSGLADRRRLSSGAFLLHKGRTGNLMSKSSRRRDASSPSRTGVARETRALPIND